MSHWESRGVSDEWRTPAWLFGALDCVFDLDVATAPDCSTVPCVHRIFKRSLETEWHGFVWMNPPFGGRNALEPWLDKFFRHGNGIALVPDRTSAPWFQRAWKLADLVLFTPKIWFVRPDGSEGKSPSNGTALMAKGPAGCDAVRSAYDRGLGILAQPITPKRMQATPDV